jgi:hypothetical protein
MAKNLLHCETGFGVYRSTQLGHIPFFLLLYLLVGPSIGIQKQVRYATCYTLVWPNARAAPLERALENVIPLDSLTIVQLSVGLSVLVIRAAPAHFRGRALY